MALNPDVLILDEPFAGLDKKTHDFLVSFLGELKANGKTLVIATHDESLAPSLGDAFLDMNG
jgi:energy-coupling factor transporter ATP-binding protein EcfA2